MGKCCRWGNLGNKNLLYHIELWKEDWNEHHQPNILKQMLSIVVLSWHLAENPRKHQRKKTWELNLPLQLGYLATSVILHAKHRYHQLLPSQCASKSTHSYQTCHIKSSSDILTTPEEALFIDFEPRRFFCW